MKKYTQSLCLFLILSTASAYAISPHPELNQTYIIEITDKYEEVRLGITDNYIYMTFSDGVRQVANKDFENQFKVKSQAFTDSEGNFIIEEERFLNSNIIEIPIQDIEDIVFSNGKVTFKYLKEAKIGFEDVQSYNGVQALENFFIEDLEKFALAYQDLKS